MEELAEYRSLTGGRWFHNDEFDLYFFTDEAGNPSRFQLCYQSRSGEKALTWHGAEYTHLGVADEGFFNATPILVADGTFNADRVRERFAACTSDMDAKIRDFVLDHIDEAGLELSKPE
jgi:hypothetical protein